MVYLAKLGELTLKGSNIRIFENRLLANARLYLKNTKARVRLRAGRLYVECNDDEERTVLFMLAHLAGITGFAKTFVAEKNIDDISNLAKKIALLEKEKGARSFKIETKREDKSFPLSSYEICAQVGAKIADETMLAVDVHTPDVKINIEVRDKCYLFSENKKGIRGLPALSSGKGLLLLSGGIDSPVAGFRMIARGMKIDCAYFHSYPYTSEEAQAKVETLASILARYGISVCLNIIPFTAVQMQIKKSSPTAWTTLMLRVCMMKAANALAEKINASCIITGESLGQVASQTIENLAVTEHFAELQLLRPLIGLDKEEIIESAKKIGTYETSILPYEDCCVLFSPRHPVLRGTIDEAEKIYASLEIDELIQNAFENREIKKFTAV